MIIVMMSTLTILNAQQETITRLKYKLSIAADEAEKATTLDSLSMFYYINVSQYKAALDMSLKGISMSNEYYMPDYLAALYYNCSWVYFNLGDLVSGLNNAFSGKSFLKDDEDRFYDQALHLNGIIGNIYLVMKKEDSAFHYFSLVASIADTSKELAAKDISDWYWGMYYLSKKDYSKADAFLSKGIAS